jgi:hypothetical protein
MGFSTDENLYNPPTQCETNFLECHNVTTRGHMALLGYPDIICNDPIKALIESVLSLQND